MPVTAKLSKLFYDRLGEQIANELVDWFNQVDATYRADLRDLNDRNFALFDAKLDQRFARVDERFVSLRAEMKDDLRAVEIRMIRWMFAMWMTTALAILLK